MALRGRAKYLILVSHLRGEKRKEEEENREEEEKEEKKRGRAKRYGFYYGFL